MNRRAFLQVITGAAVAAVVPVPVSGLDALSTGFIPVDEYAGLTHPIGEIFSCDKSDPFGQIPDYMVRQMAERMVLTRDMILMGCFKEAA